MASATCASCIFGATSISTINVPLSIVGTQAVVQFDRVLTINGTVTTQVETATLSSGVAPPTGSFASSSTLTVEHPTQATVSTLGTVLTAGTVYVSYAGFAGAAATGSVCAQTLSPTPLALPTDAGASLIYPESPTLPAALLAYLDGPGGFEAQLNGDPVTGCLALGSVPPIPTNSLFGFQSSSSAVSTSSSASSLISSISATTTSSSASSLSSSLVAPFPSTNATTTSATVPVPPPSSSSSSLAPISISTSTSVANATGTFSVSLGSIPPSTTVTSTVSTSTTIATTTTSQSATTETTTLPPPTTFTTNTPVLVSTSVVVPTTQVLSYTPVLVLTTISGSTLYGASATPTFPSPQPVSLPSSSVAATNIGELLSALASLSLSSSKAPSTALSTASSTRSSSPTTGEVSSTTTYVVSPITPLPPYPYNGTNVTTFSSTTTAGNGSVIIVPYTGSANRVLQPMGRFEALLGLAMPLLLW